jgi:hypothetical protein
VRGIEQNKISSVRVPGQSLASRLRPRPPSISPCPMWSCRGLRQYGRRKEGKPLIKPILHTLASGGGICARLNDCYVAPTPNPTTRHFSHSDNESPEGCKLSELPLCSLRHFTNSKLNTRVRFPSPAPRFSAPHPEVASSLSLPIEGNVGISGPQVDNAVAMI